MNLLIHPAVRNYRPLVYTPLIRAVIRSFLLSNWVLVMPLIILMACGSPGRVSDLVIDNSNALQASLSFRASGMQQPVIRYWNAEEPGEVLVKVLPEQEAQDIVLFRLEPDSRYAFQVMDDAGNADKQADTLYFKTPRLPYTLPKLNILIDSGNVFDGYILVRKVEDPARQLLLDHEGRVVWYHEFDTALSRFYSWTPRGTILSLHDEDEIVEFDLEGKVLNRLRYGEGGFDQHLHHEIIENEKGQIVSLTRNMQLFDLSAFGGLEQDTIFGDGILVLDQEGNKVWEWDIYEHEDPLQDERINEMKKDWSHANSLDIDRDGHYLISFRNFHQVWKVHGETGEILWKLGMNGDFDLGKEEVFLSQHTAHVNPFGELMIFDNGGPERMYSRAISFEVNGMGDYRRGRIWIQLPRELYSFKEGSAYMTGEDRVLFCSSRTNQLVITDREGNIYWQLRSSASFYRAYYIPDIPELDIP